MSEQTNTVTVADRQKLQVEFDLEAQGYKINPVTECYEKSRGDGLKYVANIFSTAGDKFLGLCWISIEAESNDQVSLDAFVNKYGSAHVVGYANAAFRNAQRNKAKNSTFSKDVSETFLANLRMRDPIFFNEDQADKWMPGERETSIAQYDKKIREVVDAIKDRKIATEEKIKLRAQLAELMQARTELTLREAEMEAEQSE